MPTLVWVLVILNGSTIENEELQYPSLQKCEMYENQINRPINKEIAGYPYGAYCKPVVVSRP